MPNSSLALSLPAFNASQFFPFLKWKNHVTRENFKADAVAGLTGALVVLPQGVAFATIAGLPPEYGLYAGMVPAIIAALFGSSWHLVSGPTTAASVVIFSILSALAEPGTANYVSLALTLTFMVGMVQLIMGLLRLGILVNFISHAVIVGFTAGAAIHIAANQIKHFFGLAIPRGSAPHEALWYLLTHLPEISPAPFIIGAITLAAGLAWRKFLPRIPYMITALLAGSICAFLLSYSLDLVIPTVGALPASLPPLSHPSLNPADWQKLAPSVLAVTLFALTEAVSISRALALRSGQRINGNQEFIGQGLSNLVGSFFSAYVATGSFNRSAVNYESGARTPMAAILAGLVLAAIVPLVAPLAVWLPNAAMAGILFLVAWGLFDRKHIRQILKTSRNDTVILIITFVTAVFVDLEHSILAGVLLSLLVYLARTSRPNLQTILPDRRHKRRKINLAEKNAPECPQLHLRRIDGPLYFGSANAFLDTLERYGNAGQPRHLILDASGVNFIDSAGIEALTEGADHLRKAGGGLHLVYLSEEAELILKNSGHLDAIGTDHLHASLGDALNTIIPQMDRVRCRSCPLELFLECPQLKQTQPADPLDTLATEKS